VGKIYKPALKRMEARDELEAALREAGLPFRVLEIVDDSVRGMAARVEIERADSSDRARRVLGQFAIPFTISTAGHEETAS
jgi:hypothetical protein